MDEIEYKDNEKVLYKTKAKLSLPHKEPEEVNCFVTEGNLVIEAEEPIKIPLLRIRRHQVAYETYETPPQTATAELLGSMKLTYLDELNQKQKVSFEPAASVAVLFNQALSLAIGKAKGQYAPSGDLLKAILIPLVGSFFVFLILLAIEGAAGAPAAAGSRVPHWLAGLFAVCGAGIGVAISWGWAQKVSSWKRLVTFLLILPLMATVWALVFLGVLGALPAAAIHAVLLILSWFRAQERFRWPW